MSCGSTSQIIKVSFGKRRLVGGLEVWNMNFMTFPILGMSSSPLTFTHIFQRARAQPPTRRNGCNFLSKSPMNWNFSYSAVAPLRFSPTSVVPLLCGSKH